MELSLRSSMVGTTAVLHIEGEVDVYSSPAVQEQVDALLEPAPHRVVVDMSSVTFLDSTGLGTFVAGLKRAEQLGGTLVVAGAQERVLKLFRITGLDSVFTMHDSVDDAAVQLAGASG